MVYKGIEERKKSTYEKKTQAKLKGTEQNIQKNNQNVLTSTIMLTPDVLLKRAFAISLHFELSSHFEYSSEKCQMESVKIIRILDMSLFYNIIIYGNKMTEVVKKKLCFMTKSL